MKLSEMHVGNCAWCEAPVTEAHDWTHEGESMGGYPPTVPVLHLRCSQEKATAEAGQHCASELSELASITEARDEAHFNAACGHELATTERALLKIWPDYAEDLGAESGEFDPLLEALNEAYNLGVNPRAHRPREGRLGARRKTKTMTNEYEKRSHVIPLRTHAADFVLAAASVVGVAVGLVLDKGLRRRRSFAESPKPTPCPCARCEDERRAPLLQQTMILCPKCGNKRCPKAQFHGYRCGNSNELGQVGIPERAEPVSEPEAKRDYYCIPCKLPMTRDAARVHQCPDEPEAPRAVVVGSVWRNKTYGHMREVSRVTKDSVYWFDSDGYSDIWLCEVFVDKHEHVSNPAPESGEKL